MYIVASIRRVHTGDTSSNLYNCPFWRGYTPHTQARDTSTNSTVATLWRVHTEVVVILGAELLRRKLERGDDLLG